MVESAMKTFVRPIKKENILNTGISSEYYYTSISHDDRKNHCLARVESITLNMTSKTVVVFVKAVESWQKLHGMRVDLPLGSSTSGSLFLIMMVFSGLSGENTC